MNSESYKPNIWKYYLVEILTGFWFIIPIWLIFFRSFEISYSQIALLEITGTIVVILFEIPTGVFADFIGKKWSVFLSCMFWVIAMIIIGLGSTFLTFFVGYLFWGTADAFYSGAGTSLLYDSLKRMKKEKDYLKFKGRAMLLGSLSLIAGSIAGGFLYGIDKRLPWLLYASTFLVAALVTVLIKEPFKNVKRFSIKNQIQHTKDSIKFSITHKEVRLLTIFLILSSLSVLIFINLMEQSYLLSIGLSVVSLGVIFAVTRGVTGLLSNYIYKIEERFGEKSSFYLITLVYSSVFVILGMINLPIMVAFVILLFFTRNYRDALIDKYVNKHIRPYQRATVLSVQSLFLNISSSMFYLVGGFLLDRFSLDTIMIALGLVTFATLIPFLFFKYRNNK